jgi:hypothetical protein
MLVNAVRLAVHVSVEKRLKPRATRSFSGRRRHREAHARNCSSHMRRERTVASVVLQNLEFPAY